ncbi:MAG: ThuA domain-containing protein [Ginsengibacter sp.]
MKYTTIVRSLFILLATISMLPSFGKDSQSLTFHLKPIKPNSHIVFLISKDPLNYEADKTVPPFAEMLRKEYGFHVTVLMGEGQHGSYQYKGLDIIKDVDLLVVFCRRLALPFDQMDMIKNYLRAGKPLVGIRTANHGFSVRDKVSDGFEGWWGFVPDILGCENRGYEAEELGTNVKIASTGVGHSILRGIDANNWHSNGQVYKVKPLVDSSMIVLLIGNPTGSKGSEPIAWTRQTAHKSRVFYTSLGYPEDFKVASFRKLIVNAIHWALDLDPK